MLHFFGRVGLLFYLLLYSYFVATHFLPLSRSSQLLSPSCNAVTVLLFHLRERALGKGSLVCVRVRIEYCFLYESITPPLYPDTNLYPIGLTVMTSSYSTCSASVCFFLRCLRNIMKASSYKLR